MSGYDNLIGTRLAELRSDMSQRDFARRMQDRGWKWTHLTVGAIERGTRPIRLSEAVDAVIVLGVNLDSLTGIRAVATDESAMRDMLRAMKEVQSISMHALLSTIRPFEGDAS